MDLEELIKSLRRYAEHAMESNDDSDMLMHAADVIESLQEKVAELEKQLNSPAAVFDGYIDNMPVIKWTNGGLPVGTKLYAISNPK